MPGSPPFSPRFDVPRYDDGDTAEFGTQTSGITDTFDAAVARRLVPNVLSGSATASDHQVVVAGASETVTLPAPSSEHELICVYAKDDASGVSGSAPVTVQVTSGKVYGKGLGVSGVTSFLLGTPGAFTWLFSYDGTNYRIVHGERDTGWVPVTLQANWSALTNAFVPAARLRGDKVELRGTALAAAGATSLVAEMVAPFIPSQITFAGSPPIPISTHDGSSNAAFSSALKYVNSTTVGVDIGSASTGTKASLDGASYSI